VLNHSIANQGRLHQLVSGLAVGARLSMQWPGAELKPPGMDGEGGAALSPVGFEVA